MWQAWYFLYLHRCQRKLGDVLGLMWRCGLLRGRRGTFNTLSLMMVPALRELPVAPDCLAVPLLPVPYHCGGLRCLAVPRFGIFHCGYGSLLHL